MSPAFSIIRLSPDVLTRLIVVPSVDTFSSRVFDILTMLVAVSAVSSRNSLGIAIPLALIPTLRSVGAVILGA